MNLNRVKLILCALGIAVALVVAAAHWYRAGQFALAAGYLVLVVLLFIRHRFAALAVQAALVLAVLEWLRTLAMAVALRVSAGAPYGRLVVILASVAMLTLASVLLFSTRALRMHFRRDK